MSIIFAKVKKKSRIKKAAKKAASSRKKKVTKKKSVKKKSNKIQINKLFSRFKIDQNNWIVFYYAAAYVGIFGLFALAIYYSN
tara:strand:- start:60 stop:308 length:249 start_codon:yes stop_codon:yes gene_type:complete